MPGAKVAICDSFLGSGYLFLRNFFKLRPAFIFAKVDLAGKFGFNGNLLWKSSVRTDKEIVSAVSLQGRFIF